MNRRFFGWPLVLAGVVVLWVGWGNAWNLVKPYHLACAVTDPPGLHLDGLLRIVYTDNTCTGDEYRHAWKVFLSLSTLGLALVGGGTVLLRR
ncbi:hypothetical protein SAMN05216388_100290 [Halorientalis persicus]|uniref:Uncharacterized protein n=1 Tax=Halorientalis persicus TaxID=1367881 RepID=A0A1H8ES57_9EURY|nr:hypothetical protein [Halorientalis persicus]SEN22206.1 hypothetical protein SAMN05216388_100290 [Halorientalis persicus]